MKLATIALLSSLAVLSVSSHASNNTYVYSNTEYCQLASDNSAQAHLAAYSRKLGFVPSANDCRALLELNADTAPATSEQDIRKMLKEALNGSVIRPSASLSRKLAEMSEAERQQALAKLFS